MALIFETDHFLVQSAEFPLVDRADGGHITIDPKFAVSTRQELTPQQSVELMRLLAVAGEAMTGVLQQAGIDIGRINYQDNGNWSVFRPAGPQLHYHLYGRARSAKIQPYGQSLHFPHKDEQPAFYENNKPLTLEDVNAIANRMKDLFREERYQDRNWSLQP